MHEQNVVLDKQNDYSIMQGRPPWQYELMKREGGRMGGSGGFGSICDEIGDTGLLSQDMRNRVTLTDLGHRFAAWLIRNDKKAAYFNSTLGGWGDRPEALTQPDVTPGMPGWPIGRNVPPGPKAPSPPTNSPTRETMFAPDLPSFLGMRSPHNAQQQSQAATPSPDAAAGEAAQASERPPTDPTA